MAPPGGKDAPHVPPELRTLPLEINGLEVGYLLGMLLTRFRADPEDVVAEALLVKTRAVAVAFGAVGFG